MNDEQAETKPKERREERAPRPVGAILVTTFLAVVILVTWFGMYFLNFARG